MEPLADELVADGSFSDPIVLDSKGEEQVKAWPADFYVTNIITYFHAHKSRSKSLSADALFCKHFGLAYRHSTVYDHLARWKAASQSAKDAVLATHRTPAGLWSVFMETNPAKDASLKATACKLKQQASVASESS